jgi:hypothetical protein
MGSQQAQAAGARGRVWIIDADHWPRAYLRAELIERGYDAVGFPAIADALTALALRPHERPGAAAIDLRGQTSAPKPLAALLNAGFPVLAFGGATESATEWLRALPWAAFLRRPLTIGALADEIERLMADQVTRSTPGAP